MGASKNVLNTTLRHLVAVIAVAGVTAACSGDDDVPTVDAAQGAIDASLADAAAAADAAASVDASIPVTPDARPMADSFVGPDAFVTDAFASCPTADASGAPSVTLTNATVTPSGAGGLVVTSSWQLSDIKVQAPVSVTGTAQGALEVFATSGTEGAMFVDLIVNISAPISGSTQETGGGYYSISGTTMAISSSPFCSQDPPFNSVEYTASPTTMTVWTTVMISGFNIAIEAEFTRL